MILYVFFAYICHISIGKTSLLILWCWFQPCYPALSEVKGIFAWPIWARFFFFLLWLKMAFQIFCLVFLQSCASAYSFTISSVIPCPHLTLEIWVKWQKRCWGGAIGLIRRMGYFFGVICCSVRAFVWMCVGFCSWADLCITHASWGRCAKQCSECHWVPTPLCHIVCECMHAYDSCATELQKNACLFVMKRKEREVLEVRQYLAETKSDPGLTSCWYLLFCSD